MLVPLSPEKFNGPWVPENFRGGGTTPCGTAPWGTLPSPNTQHASAPDSWVLARRMLDTTVRGVKRNTEEDDEEYTWLTKPTRTLAQLSLRKVAATCDRSPMTLQMRMQARCRGSCEIQSNEKQIEQTAKAHVKSAHSSANKFRAQGQCAK